MTAPTYSDVLVDLAQHLANAGIGQWRPDGIYKSYTPPAIYLGRIPDEAGYAIALNQYNHLTSGGGRDTGTPDVLIQIRVRGDRHPLTAGKIHDRIYQLIHEQTNYRLNNGTSVLCSRRHLRAPEDTDANLRWYRDDSYTLTLNPE